MLTDRVDKDTSDPIQSLSKVLILTFLCILAVFSVLTLIAQMTALPFRIYAILGVTLSILCLVSFLYFNKKWIINARLDVRTLFLLILIGFVCSFLALISHNPASDDYYYLPNAVYAQENPEKPMSHKIHFLDGGETCDIVSTFWGTSKAFEYMQGAFSYITKIRLLTIYYLITPAIISFLLPFTWYYLLSFFAVRPISKGVSTLFTLIVVFMLGETHRTFGNFTVARAFHGKTLLLAIGIPFYTGILLEFFNTPKFSTWIPSLITVTALTGATTSTLILLPLLTGLIILSSLVSMGRDKMKIKYLLFLGLSFLYLLIYGLYLKTHQTVNVGMNSPINQGWPTNFLGHWYLMFRDHRQITLYVLIFSSITPLFLLQKTGRKFIGAWMLGSIVLFLNPFVAPVIIKHITSPNIYWRLFYLYPFPLTLAISNAVVITKIRKSKPIIKYPLWITYLVLIVLAFSSSFTKTIFHPGNEVRFPPEYKLPAELNSLAPKIVKHAPEGTMLAPPELSGVIPLFSSSFPQIRVRENGLKLWFDSCGLPPQAANTRIKASEFVGGKDEEFDSFAQFLDAEGKLLNTIVIHQSALDKNVQKQMLRYGFTYRIKVGSYLIFSDTG